MVICSNRWEQEVCELKSADDRKWIRDNMVYYECNAPLWIQ